MSFPIPTIKRHGEGGRPPQGGPPALSSLSPLHPFPLVSLWARGGGIIVRRRAPTPIRQWLTAVPLPATTLALPPSRTRLRRPSPLTARSTLHSLAATTPAALRRNMAPAAARVAPLHLRNRASSPAAVRASLAAKLQDRSSVLDTRTWMAHGLNCIFSAVVLSICTSIVCTMQKQQSMKN
ncbi:hypothetical protein SORBI_3005G092900 [Sorghum bicolor]|uniref:Uncharacterized protein n=1 Tax=Sorghum bicolor TaxID=4558 RepID=A0A1B6PR61_SORBI|nr:hypothetical protein SORBI_3005G092900 [Sorghum bicolor]